MNCKAKYIIIQRGGIIIPVVFGDLLGHDEIGRALCDREQIVSAGFVQVVNKMDPNSYIQEARPQYECYGESVTLKLKSRGEADSEILNRYLGASLPY